MTEELLINGLKNGDSEALKIIYTRYRNDFINFANRYSVSDEVIVDVYQNAIIALRENSINGKIDNLKSELKTYLFSIGKYMIYEELRQNQKLHLVKDNHYFETNSNFDISDLIIEHSELSEKQKILQKAFKTMGAKCKEILTLFYYRGYDLEEIMHRLKYSSKDVVKSQKSRCLKALKSMISHK